MSRFATETVYRLTERDDRERIRVGWNLAWDVIVMDPPPPGYPTVGVDALHDLMSGKAVSGSTLKAADDALEYTLTRWGGHGVTDEEEKELATTRQEIRETREILGEVLRPEPAAELHDLHIEPDSMYQADERGRAAIGLAISVVTKHIDIEAAATHPAIRAMHDLSGGEQVVARDVNAVVLVLEAAFAYYRRPANEDLVPGAVVILSAARVAVVRRVEAGEGEHRM